MKKEKPEAEAAEQEARAEAPKEHLKCLSCGKRIEAEREWVEFPCPGCSKERVLRCERCKTQMVTYACKCGFEGP